MTFSKEYIQKPLRLFFKTFRNKKLPLILLIDIIFYLIFYLGFKIYADKAKNIIMSLQNIDLSILNNLQNVEIDAANQLLSQLQMFMLSMISATIVFTLFIIVILTIIKGYEWSKIVKNKLELFDYVKLLILNILWFIIWVIIFTIPFFFIERQAYLTHIYYLIPPILYFTLFLYMNYAETKRIGKALKAPITEGLLKVYKYVSAIVIIVLFFEIPFVILKLLKLSPTIHLIIFSIIALIVLAVYKLYFYVISTEKEYF